MSKYKLNRSKMTTDYIILKKTIFLNTILFKIKHIRVHDVKPYFY